MKIDGADNRRVNVSRGVLGIAGSWRWMVSIGAFALGSAYAWSVAPTAATAQEASATSTGALASSDGNRGSQPPSGTRSRYRDGLIVPTEPVDAELESSMSGDTVHLASLRDRVRVVFYEDREHVAQNERLKGTLQRFIADNQLEAELALLPIGNADGFRFEPAASLVRAGLSAAASRMNLDILIDWNRTLQAPPFSMSGGASCVLVIDREGRILFRHNGQLKAPEQSALFRAIRRALRSRS